MIRTVTSILYFHGFASSPTSRKLILLREMLRGEGFHFDSPDLNLPSFALLDWEAMIQEGTERLASKPDLIVGSSLGGLLAIDMARRSGSNIPILLISPALGFGNRWDEFLPDDDPITVYRHATERDEQIHRAFFAAGSLKTADQVPPPGRVVLIMGSEDESVPPQGIRDTWRTWLASGELSSGSKLIEIAGADHSLLDHIDLIADEIRRVVTPS